MEFRTAKSGTAEGLQRCHLASSIRSLLSLTVRRQTQSVLLLTCIGLLLSCQAGLARDPSASSGEFLPADLYPTVDVLVPSPGDSTYFVDPIHGSDANSGIAADKPWRTLARLNQLQLAPGDKVRISPGVLDISLMPHGKGTAENPVVIRFLAGIHEFRSTRAARVCRFVSNSADAPYTAQPVGVLVNHCSHFRVEGAQGAELIYADRMTQFINEYSDHITYQDLTFDMARPTVSEFRVVATSKNSATIRVAEGSTYGISDGRFKWSGDIGSGWTMAQEAIPDTGRCFRLGKWDPFLSAHAEQLADGTVRLTYKGDNIGLKVGHQYQFRNTQRDTVSGVNARCRDLAFFNCRFYALPGMGVVSQFTENLTFRGDAVVPKPGTLRTCPAWADCFHFSGCGGKILVESCRFSGTQDDPINVHGTFLQLVDRVSPNVVTVRFMHPQTFGFAAFQPGDSIEFVSHVNLRPFHRNKVRSVAKQTDKEWRLTLDSPVASFAQGDVIDNISWYPDLTIRGCAVTMDSCRGFLITTRGKVLVENNTFTRTEMSAIDIADDANSWFESGGVRGMTIRNNRFVECGEPAIFIHPENQTQNPNEPVHENIQVVGNMFLLNGTAGISARSVRNLFIQDNQFSTTSLPVITSACTEVTMKGNHLGASGGLK